MRGAAMLEKHGWDGPGRQYAALYRRMLPKQQPSHSAQPAASTREEKTYVHP
jgi:hypothetical protein